MDRLFHGPFGLCFTRPEAFAIVNFASQLPGGRDGGREGGVTICGLLRGL